VGSGRALVVGEGLLFTVELHAGTSVGGGGLFTELEEAFVVVLQLCHARVSLALSSALAQIDASAIAVLVVRTSIRAIGNTPSSTNVVHTSSSAFAQITGGSAIVTSIQGVDRNASGGVSNWVVNTEASKSANVAVRSAISSRDLSSADVVSAHGSGFALGVLDAESPINQWSANVGSGASDVGDAIAVLGALVTDLSTLANRVKAAANASGNRVRH